MKLAYVALDGRSFAAVRHEDHYIDLSRTSFNWTGSLGDLIRQGPDALAQAKSAAQTTDSSALVSVEAVDHLLLTEPRTITCVGSNYAAHIRERGKDLPKEPSCFMRSLASLVPHRQALELPANSVEFDYEVELAIVVGRAGRCIPIDQALDYVAGYTLMNDGSVRDFQSRYYNVTLGKNFPNSGALGPEMVTADELPPGANGLRIRTWVNGETAQDSSTSDLIFDVPMLVSLVSHTVGLRPGDIIATGTPSGVAAGQTPPRWLKAGDQVEMEIEGVTRLSNPVVNAPKAIAPYSRSDYAPKA